MREYLRESRPAHRKDTAVHEGSGPATTTTDPRLDVEIGLALRETTDWELRKPVRTVELFVMVLDRMVDLGTERATSYQHSRTTSQGN